MPHGYTVSIGWATGKSKVIKNEIEDLPNEISTYEKTIERLQDKIQSMQDNHHRELMKLESRYQSELSRKEAEHAQENARLKNRVAWQGHIISCLSFLLLKTNGIFRRLFTVIITNPVLIRNRYRTSRVFLTCSGRAGNYTVSAVLYMDEHTPHIHATVVPIVTGECWEARKKQAEDRRTYRKKANAVRLCADDLMSREKLVAYHDSYAKAMAKYGL